MKVRGNTDRHTYIWSKYLPTDGSHDSLPMQVRIRIKGRNKGNISGQEVGGGGGVSLFAMPKKFKL